MNETYIAHYEGRVIKLVRHGEMWKSFVKEKEWGGESTDRHRCLENAKEALDEAIMNGWKGESESKTEWLINGVKVTMELDSDAEVPDEFKPICYELKMDGVRAKVFYGVDALKMMVKLNKLERDQ